MNQVSRTVTLLIALLGGVSTHAASFTNSAAINVPNSGSGTTPASLYPSTINVSGVSGTISKLTMTLMNINYDRPDDLEILLVGPTGKKFVLLADAGGTVTPASGATVTFDDAAASQVPDSGPLSAGSFKPTCVDAQGNIQTEFPAPAPAGTYDVPAPTGSSTLASSFNGTNPNGAWSLYVVDDIPSAAASIGGWFVTINTGGASPEPTTTTVASSVNPSLSGNSVAFTATVRRTNNTAVTSGGVIFKEGTTVLQASNVVNGSGQVTFTTGALSEGMHVITAEYTGNATFLPSSAAVSQAVDNPTTTNGNTFANRGTITVGDTANVYPSHIFVTNLSGSISKLVLTVSNITYGRPDDLELLLVAPNGAEMILMADAGGTAAGISGVNLTFDDAAGNLIPDATAPSSGTYRPTDYNSTAAAFPAPAPAAPYNHPAPAGGATLANVFNGGSPNGTWSLYVADDSPGTGGTLGGWSLTFTTSGDAPTATTLSSSLNPSVVGQSITITARVVRVSNGAAVTNGSVTFREGSAPIATVALNTNGLAFFTTSSLTPGNHIVSGDYGGVPGSFNVSSGSITQQVDNATTVSSNRFANGGVITIPQDGSVPSVYPSRILVTNAGGAVSNISITVSNISIDRPDDLEFLLVSPSGARMVLLSDAGGISPAANNITLTFSDAAANQIPDAGPLATGTFKPTSVNSTAAAFPPPAPGAPYNQPAPAGSATLASVFNGTNPNGYWSLYVIDDVPGGTGNGTIANGWTITLLTAPVLNCQTNIATTNALGQCQSAAVSFAATASGFPTPVLTYRVNGTNVTSPLVFPVGVTTVTTIASNSAGTNGCSFTVTVIDAQKPLIQCPVNMIVSRDPGVALGTVTFTVTGSDNCAVPTVVSIPPSGADFPFGVTTVNSVAYDAAGNSNTCSFTVTVNRNPVANPDRFQTPTNTLLAFAASVLLTNDFDGDGNPLSVTSVDSASANGGTITLAGGNVTYRPATNFFGPDYFQYVVGDGQGGSATGLVFVTVTRTDAFRLSITRTNLGWSLRFIGAPGHTYLLQYAQTITGPWSNLLTIVMGTNAVFQTNDLTAPAPQTRFYKVVEIPPGGVALWRGEGSGDDTYALRNGALLNGISFVPGRVGRAFSFDGVDDAVVTGGAAIPVPWTAAMWVNRQPSLDTSSALLSDDGGALKLEQWPNTQQVGFTAYGVADYVFNYVAPAGAWTHLVFVATPAGTALYANGNQVDFLPVTIALPTDQISRNASADRLRGSLDELQLFNRALTPLEIKALYYSAP